MVVDRELATGRAACTWQLAERLVDRIAAATGFGGGLGNRHAVDQVVLGTEDRATRELLVRVVGALLDRGVEVGGFHLVRSASMASAMRRQDT